MAANEPIDPVVRLAISQWPDDAPRGAVTTFCAEHGISRKSFYELRKRAVDEGQAAVLEPRSRRPKSSPSRLADEVRAQAVAVRAAWRRFVYPAPNACWQLDATEYVLTRGRKCVIFQLIDDHSRLAVASHVAWTETSTAAITTFDKAVGRYGVPQRLLTDNGIALNPTRRGHVGQLVAHVTALGVEAITGKPYKPTTQGKNERLHQTLFRWLDKQPLAQSLDELQAQVDRFDRTYNTERPHQFLPGRITPQAAYNLTRVADPPRPKLVKPLFPRPPAQPKPTGLPVGTVARKVTSIGTVVYENVAYLVDVHRAFQWVLVAADGDQITVIDLDGVVLMETTPPAPGTRYVGNGKPPGTRPKNPRTSPKS